MVTDSVFLWVKLTSDVKFEEHSIEQEDTSYSIQHMSNCAQSLKYRIRPLKLANKSTNSTLKFLMCIWCALKQVITSANFMPSWLLTGRPFSSSMRSVLLPTIMIAVPSSVPSWNMNRFTIGFRLQTRPRLFGRFGWGNKPELPKKTKCQISW